MFALKRNQVIITALVIMICVAGYLNYIDSQNSMAVTDAGYDLTAGGEVSAIVLDDTTGQNVEVINTSANNSGGIPEIATGADTSGTSGTNAGDSEPGTAVFVNSSSDSSFFVQAKLNREQDRAKQKEDMTALINTADIDETKKAECAESIIKITNRAESEAATEAALEAKGFGESYVRIDDNWVEVIIVKSVLTDQELAQLEDIVTRLTGATIETMRVSSVKAE